MKPYNSIILEKRDEIGILTFNKPQLLNAIGGELLYETYDALSRIDGNKSLKVLIITGAGRCFQAGGDIREMQKQPLAILAGLGRVNSAIEKLRQPVIAAINGAAIGGGLELAISCQIRIAVQGAKLGLPEVKNGLSPGAGGADRLLRIVGKGMAYEMLLSGEPIDAEKGYRIGLINRVVPRGEALAAAIALAEKIIANGPAAVELIKAVVETGLDLPLQHAVRYSLQAALPVITQRK